MKHIKLAVIADDFTGGAAPVPFRNSTGPSFCRTFPYPAPTFASSFGTRYI